MVWRRARIGVLALALLVPPAAGWAQDPASEEFARRQYESGLAFLREQKFAEALKDFQAVVDAYPASRVADAALLRIAEYQLDVAGNPAGAQATVDALQKKYATTESGPMALVLAGRISMATGRTPAGVESALASYERVPRLFPGSDAVPASYYYAAEALRLTHRDEEAAVRYRQVSTDFPQSPWAPRALLGEARCLVTTGRASRAMELLQRVRQRFPGTAEAATALEWNTVIYRLYLRAPAQPAYQFSGRAIAGTAGRLRDVQALGVDPGGTVWAATKNAVLAFDPSGQARPSVPANDPRSIVFDRSSGRPVIVCREGVLQPGGQAKALAAPKNDGSLRSLDDMTAGVLTSSGDLLVVDKNARDVVRFSASGQYLGPYVAGSVERLAIDGTDRLAVLDTDSGAGIALLDQDGKPRARIPSRGQGYEFDRAVDIAIDLLGHVYVLDRGRASVLVFTQDQQPKLLTAFTIAPKAPGYFKRARCFAIDPAGRLYIYDEDAEKIQIYQ
jgi:TolA-binding protein